MGQEIRLSALVGLPVVLEGKSIGRVEQPVLTPDGHALRGLVVRRGLGGARWLNAEELRVAGSVSVVANEKPGKVPEGADFALHAVRDTSGLNLGVVTDVWLEPASLRVAALEILLGLIEALTCGPLRCERFAVSPEGPDQGLVLLPQDAWLERQRTAHQVARR